MPIGVIVNVCSVVMGGLSGSLLGEKVSTGFRQTLTIVFGFCAMTMGITSVILVQNMPAVFFSMILGTALGTLLHLDARVRRGVGTVLKKVHLGGDIDFDLLQTAIVLFCASGTGIYGTLISGIDGDHSILIAKSVLDLFTALIFACNLRKATCLIALPQLVIMLLLFFSARLIYPLTTEVMINDFKAVSGIVLLATGLSILKVVKVPLIDLVPAMLLAMPISWAWTVWIAPLF